MRKVCVSERSRRGREGSGQSLPGRGSMAGKYSEYEQCTDDELIDRLRRGETSIMDYICDKYKNLVRSKAKSMFILGADSDDLIRRG